MISGVVRPNTVLPSVRRVSSMPQTMLPHWSEPPICSVHAVAAVQLAEVVALQDHVVEFEERQRLLAVQPHPHQSKVSMRLMVKCVPTSRSSGM